MVLYHADLVPREVAEAWLKYLREELPTVAFKCSTQKQASNLGQRHLPKASSADTALQGSECLGANTLLHLLKNYTRNSDTKTAITVGEPSFVYSFIPFWGPARTVRLDATIHCVASLVLEAFHAGCYSQFKTS